MKTYCKGLEITPAHIIQAYENWANGPAGRKNKHRILEEYRSVEVLLTEIETQIQTRSLFFRPVHYYEYFEPTNGKVRIIGVQSVKQQICDYLAVYLLEDFFRAKVGFYQTSSTKGKGQIFTARNKWNIYSSSSYFIYKWITSCSI